MPLAIQMPAPPTYACMYGVHCGHVWITLQKIRLGHVDPGTKYAEVKAIDVGEAPWQHVCGDLLDFVVLLIRSSSLP